MELKNKSTIISTVLASIVLFAIVLIGYYGNQKAVKENKAQLPTLQEVQQKYTSKANEFVIDAYDNYFSPNKITFNAGQKVRVFIQGKGDNQHNLKVEGLYIESDIVGKDGIITIEFTVKDPGTYTFYSSVGNDRQNGLEGTFVVQ